MVWELFFKNVETGEIQSWGFTQDYEEVKYNREHGTSDRMIKLNGGFKFYKAVEVK